MNDQITLELIKRLDRMEAEQRRLASILPLFDVKNTDSTSRVISANQNNYAPGNYDVIILAPTSAFNLTGIADGVKGRFLYILSFGAGSINFTHQDAASVATNRLNNITAATVNKALGQSYVCWYSGTRWIQFI